MHGPEPGQLDYLRVVLGPVEGVSAGGQPVLEDSKEDVQKHNGKHSSWIVFKSPLFLEV